MKLVLGARRKRPRRKRVNGKRANGAALNQVNPRSGYRNRCYVCGGEFHLLPHCPGEQPNAVQGAPFAMETPDEGGKDVSGGEGYTTYIGLGSPFSDSVRDSAVSCDTGA